MIKMDKPLGRVYISGKVSGCDWRETQAKFAVAANELLLAGIGPNDIFNPIDVGVIFPALEYEEYMKIDIALLELCDAIYMLPDWKDSPGAKREHARAEELGLTIIYAAEPEELQLKQKKHR